MLSPPSHLHEAQALDKADPLQTTRSKFTLPAPVYLCGNSLGPLPKSVPPALQRHLDKWGALGVGGHFRGKEPWADIERVAAQRYVPLVGAARDEEVAVMNSLTVNLHLMLTAFYRPRGKQRKILVEEGMFCSDEYAVQTHVASRGLDPEVCIERLRPRKGEALLREGDVVRKIRDMGDAGTLALVLMPGVQYVTGQVFPMEEIARAGREVGVPIGMDLAHAVGNVELKLHEWGVDFAVWCSYKYINGGPGGVGGAFLHERWFAEELPRLAGWWGQERGRRFGMGKEFVPQMGIWGFQVSNPSVFSIVGVAEGLRVFEEAGGMGILREKSVILTGFLEKVILERLGEEVEIISPREIEGRGCQLSLKIRKVKGAVRRVNEELEKVGVVCDVREPDILRVAPTPLYNRFVDCVLFVDALEKVLLNSSANA